MTLSIFSLFMKPFFSYKEFSNTLQLIFKSVYLFFTKLSVKRNIDSVNLILLGFDDLFYVHIHT